LFKITVRKGSFSWDFDEKARRYDEEHHCGRYVITTSLDKDEVPAAEVVRYHRSLQNVEHRFRVLKDFLNLGPIFHWTDRRTGARPRGALRDGDHPSRQSWPRTS
jgi:hypothetical protein